MAFFPVGDSEIELVKPTSDDFGVAKFLAERGGGMHHLCFEVDDIVGMMASLKEKGVRLINDTPRSCPAARWLLSIPRAPVGCWSNCTKLQNKKLSSNSPNSTSIY